MKIKWDGHHYGALIISDKGYRLALFKKHERALYTLDWFLSGVKPEW